MNQSTASISAMELRKQPGTILDRVFYRNEQFIVEKSGQPRAAIIPYGEFEQIQEEKAQARKRLFSSVDKMRKGFKKFSSKQAKSIIQKSIKNAS